LLAALLLLSVAGTKRTVYLLPLVPVAALLSAGYLEAVWRRPTRGQRLLLTAQTVLAAAGVAAAVLAARAAPQGDPDADLFRAMAQRLTPGVPFYAYNVNLDILGKALLEMPRPPREEYSVERLVAVCQKEPTFVLSEVEHLREPHVAPLRQALLPLYVGKSADKVVALYRTKTRE
jgi:hypothetical protein